MPTTPRGISGSGRCTVRASRMRGVWLRGGPRPWSRAASSRELVDYYADQVRRAFRGVNVLAGLILIIILVALADTLAGDVLERTRELGMLRAIGIAARHVRRMVVVEALLLALLGLALAL